MVIPSEVRGPPTAQPAAHLEPRSRTRAGRPRYPADDPDPHRLGCRCWRSRRATRPARRAAPGRCRRWPAPAARGRRARRPSRSGTPARRSARCSVPARRRPSAPPSSVLTSTRVTSPEPDQARPVSATGPAATVRSRVMKSGKPGGTEQRPRQDPRHRHALVVGLLTQPVGLVLEAVELVVDDLDVGEPLDVRHAVPAGHHQPGREAVLHRQRRAVHLGGHQHVRPQRLGDRQRPGVVLLDAALDTVVGPGEHHVEPRRAAPRRPPARRRAAPPSTPPSRRRRTATAG